MAKFRASMRTSLGFTVLVMGMLGMALAVATGEAFRQLALNNQRVAFVTLAKLEFNGLLEDLRSKTVQMGLGMQQSPTLKQAIRHHDDKQIAQQLDQHFHRSFVTLGQVKLLRAYAIDPTFQLLAASNEGDANLPANALVCQKLLDKTSQRRGAARLKPESELCLIGKQAALATIVPVGGLKIQGYLLLVADPTPNIARAEEMLGTPMSILDVKGVEIYKSSKWPATIGDNIMLASHIMKTPSGNNLLELRFATNIAHLQKQLSGTRNVLFAIAVIVMLGTALLALFIFQRTALMPLAMLTNHLRRVQNDKSQLGNKVTVQGSSEIVTLATDFNNMSSELNTVYRTLESMAFTDSLTGMANRALFYDRLEQATLIASRSGTQYALLMMDLNRFKNINDTLGHHVGDQILKIVGERLQSVLRKADTAARLGGDEFAVLLPVINEDESATIVAEKIIDSLKQPITIDNHSLSIGISIGMTHCPHDGENATILMRRADMAMYHAKREGIGHIFYKNSMDSDNLFEFTLESELRKAMENHDFELYYQPKIDIKQKRITGVEALIRWIHPAHGFIPPDKFIPLAEQIGLIHPLTEWVLETALTQCAQWHANDIKIGVSVNLSAHSLNDINLLDTVRHALAKSKMDPQWLTLEITETAIMSDPDRALSTLSRLDSMGIPLSIDDFGTGYSSLAYLKRFPVSEIKIDKSFVMDMIDDISDAVIVRSTIDLAHNMGMSVVAEGIEGQDAWDQLLELGCNLGQGFLMCRPCPAADLELWLQDSGWSGRSTKVAS
jgi:diguanylate cyclase (GGDEF)-like protein